MREMMIEDLEELSNYYYLEDQALRGLVYFTLQRWIKHYDFLTPTHKNLELINMFDQNFPGIKWINEPKKKETFYLLDTIVRKISNQEKIEDIIQYLIDRSIIVYKSDENYEAYLDVLKVTKIMAGGKNQPIRRVKILDNSSSKKTKQMRPKNDKWIIKSNFQQYLSDQLDDYSDIKNFWFNEEWLHAWFEIYIDIDLKTLKMSEKEIISGLQNEDEKVLKRLMRQARAKVKEKMFEHPLIKRDENAKFGRFHEGAQAILSLPDLGGIAARNIYSNLNGNESLTQMFINRYKFKISNNGVNSLTLKHSDNCLTFLVRVNYPYDTFKKSIFEIIK